MPILFAFTLFVSALLLFMVQPMIGRMILPLLGGSPAAWNTCMVFFQFVLLLGYLYAHKLSARFSPRRQVAIHIGVLGVAIGVFALATVFGERHTPIAVLKSLAPQDSSYPMFGVLALLLVAIGIPFFAVSTTAPLLQRWFANTGHPAAKDPYFLYAASNAGSLISLLAYPLITEPSLKLNEQAWFWAVGFVVFLGLVFICGKRSLALCPNANEVPPPAAAHDKIPALRIVKWVALAFVPSSLMLGVTVYMTTDIASIPLLWVIPLALYLLTFIIAFARTPSWIRIVLGNVAPVVTLLLIYVIITQQSFNGNQFWLLALHLITYFLVALMCHTELAHDRPQPQFLTDFFLWISVGGVLGGIFNALLAPILFPLAFEYPIALGISCLLVPSFDSNEKTDQNRVARARIFDIFIPLVLLVIVAWLTVFADNEFFVKVCKWLANKITDMMQFFGVNIEIAAEKMKDGLVWAVPLIVCFFFIDRPIRFGLCVAAVLFVGEFRRANMGQEIDTERSFFGIIKVQDDRNYLYDFQKDADGNLFVNERDRKVLKARLDAKGNPDSYSYIRSLVHGTTLHGKQGVIPFPLSSEDTGDTLEAPFAAITGWAGIFAYDWRSEPLTYYHRTGPVGHMFQVARERSTKPNVGMVGLGTGSVSCYANKNLDLTFYEIDPTVKKLVEPDKYFTYVSDAKARGGKVDFVLGDARLKLEEKTDAKYDLLLVDAFSSDSIPVHLLTKEALELYMNRLTENGLLGLHISNKYVKLEFVVEKLAKELGLTALVFNDRWYDDLKNKRLMQIAPPGKTQSSWVVLAKNPDTLRVFAEDRFRTQYRYKFDLTHTDAQGREVPDEPPFNAWQPLEGHPLVKPWTDDYSDVLMVMMLPEVQKARRFFGMPTIDELTK
ncbi:fused MFS/spermidine synthase [soil metagenome]